jgi:hypothetical protein
MTSAQIIATIPASDISLAGIVNVTVTNPGGGISSAQSFTISNPPPTLASVAPTSTIQGGAAFTLTVNGKGFVTKSVLNFNGNPKATTFKSATQLTAAIAAGDIATAGTANVSVTNPTPGGGTTANVQFTINNTTVGITSLSPTGTTAGGAGITLTVNGSGFVSGSVIKFNGSTKTTTFKSANQLTAAIAASDIVTAGVVNVTVTNPAPGGGTSNAAPFTIDNTPPTLSSLSPSSATAGSGAFTLTVSGSGFFNGATVQFNGANRTTTFVSSTSVTAAILASDIAAQGTASVTVTNPAPTTAPSAAQSFSISNSNGSVPAITSLGTTHVAGGIAFTLTVNGMNFISKSVVNFNGKPETTTINSPTKLTAAIPAGDVATAGNVNVSVTNPAPGGGTSTASTFLVDGYTVSGPSQASLTAAQPAIVQITVAPSANGFAHPVSFTVSGVPAGHTAAFSPTVVTPGAKSATTALTITAGASGSIQPNSTTGLSGLSSIRPLLALGILTLLGWMYAALRMHAVPQMRRYAALAMFMLMILTGSVLAGCVGLTGSPNNTSVPLTVTAKSGTMTRTFNLSLTTAP